jgi:hyperosmotically inducible periplasmic protein
MKTLSLGICAVLIVVGGSATRTWAGDPSTKGEAAESAPDNTGRNVRDRGQTLTSADQSESKADLTLTQKIRQAVMADDSLSMTAHNVKIITVNGVVTLRGPVKTEDERTKIAAKAEQVAGAGKVQNFLEVAGAK